MGALHAHLPLHIVSFHITSHLANKYMGQYHSHSVEQDVEWLYAFDVHANAFFCSFLLTYVLQVCSTNPPCSVHLSVYNLQKVNHVYVSGRVYGSVVGQSYFGGNASFCTMCNNRLCVS